MDGVLTPDPRRRLPGRGAWLHLVPECLIRAERRSAFPRALRVPGPLDADRVRSFLQAGAAPPDQEGCAAAQDGRHHPSVIGVRELPGPDNHESKVDPT